MFFIKAQLLCKYLVKVSQSVYDYYLHVFMKRCLVAFEPRLRPTTSEIDTSAFRIENNFTSRIDISTFD